MGNNNNNIFSKYHRKRSALSDPNIDYFSLISRRSNSSEKMSLLSEKQERKSKRIFDFFEFFF